MANPRPEDKSTRTMEDAARSASERTAEQTARIAHTAGEQSARIAQATAEAGEEAARASANLLKHNAETFQNAWRFGLDMMTAATGRSTDQLGRVLGLSGDEAQVAVERSAHNAATVLNSTTAVAKVMSDISREYFAFVRHQIETTMDRMNELGSCRTAKDIAVVQSEFVRETVEHALESSRRMADMSLKATNDAKQMAQNIGRRAA
ncbi:phasin family protein [Bradyrhizobium sp. th.b2]|uniref:phasin family protein n=1 Tax=Bradyrhizobium sp. th-b2 TaxID=172088 RepID=UPI00048BC024|nr:phasin family protein [Bradyrhizobium sp. th.b2]